MNYQQASLNPASEKITLVTIESVERLKLFTSNAGDWDRVVDYFVVGVKDNGVSISSWSFSPTTKTLKIIGGVDPKLRDISVTYRFFFSTAAINLPYDLNTGTDVEWDPIINSIGSIGQQLDEENTGIVLESSSSVDFINQHGFFDEIYDTLIWENQKIVFYSWFPNIPITEKIQIFDGVVESKTFSSDKVVFRVKDFVFKLKNKVNLGLITEADGIVLPSLLDTYKRRIYGKVDKVKTLSLDATLDGYSLTGTMTTLIDSPTLTGTGTLFLSELSVGDEIVTIINNEEVKFAVQSIESNTSLTMGDESSINITDASFTCRPVVPYRRKNRTWLIAGHKLRTPTATILSVISGNVFQVDSVLDFFEDDEITVNGSQTRIRRISGDIIVTDNVVNPLPSAADSIIKRPVQSVYFNKKRLIFNRDYTVTNTTEAKIVLNDLAEFNIFEPRSVGINFIFTNASRSITTSSLVDLRTIFKVRDWIRSANISETTWYEILFVDAQSIIIRSPFTGTSGTKAAKFKNIEYIDENSLITCDCLGMEVSGLWIKTPSDAVRNLVISDAGFTAVNEDRFAKAKSDCDFILSMVIPESLGGDAPLIRDVISKINESVFGSLYGDSSQNISYSILNASKPELTDIIRDDDILSFSVGSTQKIINEVVVKYRPYVDINNGEDSFLTETHASSFVNKLIGIKNTTERICYLYETDKVKIIAQRIALFNSLSSSVISLKSKMNLAKVVVNDKIFLSLDRLYKRYGGRDRRKLGTVTGVKRDGENCEIIVSDLSNVYNRIPSIAPNTTTSYATSGEDDLLRWGYILDNNSEVCDVTSEVGLGSNIIG